MTDADRARRTCGIHLSTTIARDHSHPGATPSYLVRPL